MPIIPAAWETKTGRLYIQVQPGELNLVCGCVCMHTRVYMFKGQSCPVFPCIYFHPDGKWETHALVCRPSHGAREVGNTNWLHFQCSLAVVGISFVENRFANNSEWVQGLLRAHRAGRAAGLASSALVLGQCLWFLPLLTCGCCEGFSPQLIQQTRGTYQSGHIHYNF